VLTLSGLKPTAFGWVAVELSLKGGRILTMIVDSMLGAVLRFLFNLTVAGVPQEVVAFQNSKMMILSPGIVVAAKVFLQERALTTVPLNLPVGVSPIKTISAVLLMHLGSAPLTVDGVIVPPVPELIFS
jgi:hypothetical protein